MPTNNFEGMLEKSLSCHFITNKSLLNASGTFTRTMLYDQMKQKLSFSATNDEGGYFLYRKPLCEYGGGAGAVVLCICFPSKGAGNLVRIHGIINNLAAPARKLKLGHRWNFQQHLSKTYIQINTRMLNWKQNQASAMAISVPWPKPVGWTEEESAQERT